MELWKTVIEGYYEVSNFGNVRSIARVVPHGSGYSKSLESRLLSGTADGSGYLHVTFRVNNVKTNPSIHRLVAVAFKPNPENLPQVNHIDGVKANNFSDNLEWVTSSENMLHAYSLGLASKIGSLNTAAVLSESDVLWIRSRQGLEAGISLAHRFGVGKSTVYKIWNRETWTHI